MKRGTGEKGLFLLSKLLKSNKEGVLQLLWSYGYSFSRDLTKKELLGTVLKVIREEDEHFLRVLTQLMIQTWGDDEDHFTTGVLRLSDLKQIPLSELGRELRVASKIENQPIRISAVVDKEEEAEKLAQQRRVEALKAQNKKKAQLMSSLFVALLIAGVVMWRLKRK